MAEEYRKAERTADAERIYRQVLARNTDHTEAQLGLGVLLHQLGRDADACEHLQAAVRALPQHLDARYGLGVSLARLGRPAEAVPQFEAALRHHAGVAEIHNYLGIVLAELGRTREAERHLLRAIRLRPALAEAHKNLGTLLAELGRLPEARAALRKAIAQRGDFAGAWWHLASITTFTAEHEAELHAMQALYAQPGLPDAQRVPLAFALGKACHDRGEHQHAFAYWRDANAARRRLTPYRLGPVLAEMRAVARLFRERSGAFHPAGAAPAATPRNGEHHPAGAASAATARNGEHHPAGAASAATARNSEHHPAGAASAATPRNDEHHPVGAAPAATARNGEHHPAGAASAATPRPIFIVGMPRSGTSLVEQILASHSAVYGAGELATLDKLLREAAGDFPAGLARLDAGAWQAVGTRYLGELAEIGGEARFVTDKMPGNFLHIGAIWRLFPGAKIIHCVRDPMDTGLSCYRSHFVSDQLGYSCDLLDLGSYYRHYRALMAHWRRLADGALYDIHYEALVAEPEAEVRRLLEYCGLEFEPDCLQFHRSGRRVRTASGAQVRQPIYRDSLEACRRYEQELRPFAAALAGPWPERLARLRRLPTRR